MPPSGYTTSQSTSLTEFLASCSYALEEEARSKNLTPIQALENECSGIERVLSEGLTSPFAGPVLELTKLFYASVLKRQPQNFSYLRDHVAEVLDEVSQAVLEVHVPSLDPPYEVASR